MKAFARTRIPRRAETGLAPVSETQRSMWFLEQAGRAGAYNIGLSVRIRGPLDHEALRRALLAVARRHETLRSVFVAEDGEVRVRVLPVEEFAGLLFPPDWDGSAEAPFRLDGGPLFRARLTCAAPGEHLLLLCFHHVVYDGGSAALFWDDLWQAYTGAGLPDLEIQYTDYAAWQQERLEGGVLARQTGWWTERLADAPILSTLPPDRPRPVRRTGEGRELRVRVPAATHDALVALARAETATVYMVVLAALQAMIGLASDRTDVLVGSPVSGRVRPELQPLIGCFVNTLVLRADLTGDPAFLDHLRRTRLGVLDAFDHQEVPFDRVVESANPLRLPGTSPLFQVLYAHQGASGEVVPPPAGLTAEPVDERTSTAKFDLLLTTWEEDGDLVLSLEYATELYDDKSADRFLRELLELLTTAVTAPGTRLGALGTAPWAAPAAAAAARPEPSLPEPDDTVWSPAEEFLRDVWARLLGRTDIGRRDDFFDLGGHSFMGIRMLNWVRLEYGVALPAGVLFEARTIERLAAAVERGLGGTEPAELVRLAPGEGAPLLLVHPVGGGITCYVPLARRLPMPVYGIEAVGLDSVEAMADAYLAAAAPLLEEGPLALGGWSMGGVVAFEMARRLQDRTGRTVPVVLIDSHVPDPGAEAPGEADLVQWFAQDWGSSAGGDLGEGITGRAELWRRAEERGLLDPARDGDAARRLLERFETNIGAVGRFRVPSGHRGPVRLLAAAGETWAAGDRGWGAVTSGGLTVTPVPGDHYGIMADPGLPGEVAGFLEGAVCHD
ncbi:condensation domain-containing protein [Streptomyces sp. NPDC046860]|uniref:condensation domain-containing protein n=1 Tax=Streptomyces sp. NPDC046860 TaxID=3154495 RepID=UPI0033DE5C43